MASKDSPLRSTSVKGTLHVAYSMLFTGNTINDIPISISFSVFNSRDVKKKFRTYTFSLDLCKRKEESWDSFWFHREFDRNQYDYMLNNDGLNYLNKIQKEAKRMKIKSLKDFAKHIHNFLFELETSFDTINLICFQKEHESYQLSKLLERYDYPNLLYSRNEMVKKVDNCETLFLKKMIEKYHRESFDNVYNQEIFSKYIKKHLCLDVIYDFDKYFDDIHDIRKKIFTYNCVSISTHILLDTLYGLFVLESSQYSEEFRISESLCKLKQENALYNTKTKKRCRK